MSETELVERLEKLERAHRRFKLEAIIGSYALAAVILIAAAGAVYRKHSTRPAAQPAPNVITAHEFDVVDNSGNVRVMMGTVLGAGSVMLSDAQGKVRAEWVLDQGGAGIVLYDADGNPHVALNVTQAGESTIWLSDAQGFKMDFGSTQTVTRRTGQTQQASAASIVMFGNDEKHHVIWKAP